MRIVSLLAILSLSATAADGPGFPNIDRPGQQNTVLSSLNTTNGASGSKAISAVMMHRGYLFAPLGADHGGGQGSGALAAYNISNPSIPLRIFDSRDFSSVFHSASSVHYLGNSAENHSPIMAGNLMLVSEKRVGSAGFALLDVSNLYDEVPATVPQIVGRYSFPNVTSPSNYDGYSFAPAMQGARYVFAPTGANGLHVVDTTNPANPVQLAYRNVSQLSNLTLRAAVTIGNLLVLSSSTFPTFNGKVLLLDISDPANPTQIAAPFDVRIGYQGYVYGSHFFGAQDGALESYDFANPANIVKTTYNANAGTTLSNPEYGFGKDGYAFIGHYPGATKWDLSQSPAALVSTVYPQNPANDDYAFITPLGNMIAVTSDHSTSKKLSIGVHDESRDALPPAVNFVLPANGSVNMNRKSRIGVCFTDFVEASSLSTSTLTLRNAATLEVVPGTYSHMMGIVNFVPDALLDADSTYEVILTANGVRDWAGNAVLAQQLVTTFSTGQAISNYRMVVTPSSPKEIGQLVSFSAAIIGVPAVNLEHAWDFGDGSPLTAFSPSLTATHTYTGPGNFTITLHTRPQGESTSNRATAVQVIHRPIPPIGPTRSSTIIHEGAASRVWNVNPDNNTVTAIQSTAPHAKLHEVPVGTHPATLAAGPDGTIWVANKKDSTISIIDAASGASITTMSLPQASSPHGLTMSTDLTKAYIALEDIGQVAEVDTLSRTITRTVATGPSPRNIAYDPARGQLLVTRFISPDDAGKVTRVNLATFTLAGFISLEPSMNPESSTNGRGLPNYLGALAISPDLTQATVPSKKDNIFRGTARDRLPLTFESTVRSIASRIDLAAGAEDFNSRVDLDNNDIATAAIYSPLGNRLFVSTLGSKEIWVLDSYGGTNAFAFESSGQAPDGLAISPDGTRLFVHNFMERSVSVFNTGIICASTCGTAPLLADVPTVAVEALSPAVLRGKQLFHDSYDTRLAQDGYMSCASCHMEGGSDGRVWDFTNLGEGLRNTIDLRGKGAEHGRRHWTANFDEVQDFENQIRTLSSGNGLMTDTDFNTSTRSQPLGAPKAGVSSDLDALAAYVNSLTTVGRSPYRQADGSLTPDGLAGRAIFNQQSCYACHSGTTFSDSKRNALHRVGTQKNTSGSRLGAPIPGFDTPGLRGLWRTAPYLHDGSAATLEEVLTSANAYDFHASVAKLSSTQRAQLNAYLLQIDDLEPAANQTVVPFFSTDHAVPTDQISSSFVLTLTFSEPVTGLTLGDLQVTNATLSNLQGIGSVYTVTVMPWSRGPMEVTLAANSILASGAPNTAPMTFHALAHRHQGYRYVKLITDGGHGIWASMAEFYLHFGGARLNRGDWSVHSVSSEETASNNHASRAIDGLNTTFWHTRWIGSNPPSHPHEIVINLGSLRYFDTFEYLPRQDRNLNGTITAFRLFGSMDAITWELLDQSTFVADSSTKIKPLQFYPRTFPASELDSWIESQLGSTAPQSRLYWSTDTDGDGRDNWLEWVTLSSLTHRDTGSAFVLQPEFLTDAGDQRVYLGVSARINPAAANQTFSIESSTNLTGWTPEPINLTRIDAPTDALNPDGSKSIRFIDTVAVEDAPKRFLRLQVKMRPSNP